MPVYLMDSGNTLGPVMTDINDRIAEALAIIDRKLSVNETDYAVATAQSLFIIPHLGIGAHSPSPNLVLFMIDPLNPNAKASVGAL